MITDEERQSIINEAVEKALLLLPEVVGNLIMSQANNLKLNRAFYEKHPEFAKSKDIVSQVIEQVGKESPGLDYSLVLDKSVPAIKERLKLVNTLDMKSVSRPNRDLSNFKRSEHGEL